MSPIPLTKSDYCKGVQCPKILWLDRNKPEVGEGEISEALIRNGELVGSLAREYFGKYALVEYTPDKAVMTAKTQALIAAGAENIAEAADTLLRQGVEFSDVALHALGIIKDLIDSLVKEYDVEEQTAAKDVDEFLASLRERGLIEE